MVVNIARVLEEEWDYVEQDIRAVVEAEPRIRRDYESDL